MTIQHPNYNQVITGLRFEPDQEGICAVYVTIDGREAACDMYWPPSAEDLAIAIKNCACSLQPELYDAWMVDQKRLAREVAANG